MEPLQFELARSEHAKSIEIMRRLSAEDLTRKLGQGHWSGSGKLQSIRERISCADPEHLRRLTLYVVTSGNVVVGSVALSTFHPGFWRKTYWSDPNAVALGTFNLVVPPDQQRQGIGTFMMNEVEALAQQHHIPFVRLDAYLDNPHSRSFYTAIGYSQRKIIDVRTVGLVLMEKQVLFD